MEILPQNNLKKRRYFPHRFSHAFFSSRGYCVLHKQEKGHITLVIMCTPGPKCRTRINMFLSILSSPSNGLSIRKRVMQHKLLSKMLGAHVDEGLESGNRTGNKLLFLILRCLENRDEESTFFAPCVSKDQFLSTVWIHSLYCARRIFYSKLF